MTNEWETLGKSCKDLWTQECLWWSKSDCILLTQLQCKGQMFIKMFINQRFFTYVPDNSTVLNSFPSLLPKREVHWRVRGYTNVTVQMIYYN